MEGNGDISQLDGVGRSAKPGPSADAHPTAESPRITIITPSLNCRHYICQAIDSVLRQSYPDVEHIILDAGSTDGTLDALACYRHLQVVSEPDEGAHDAMNKGVKLATGEIIGFLNGDDFYAEATFTEVARRFAEDPDLDMVCGGSVVFEDRDDGKRCIVVQRHHNAANSLSWPELMLGAPALNAYFFRRRLFDRTGLFDLQFFISADRNFLIRAALAGIRSNLIPRPVYFYRQHAGSQTINVARRFAREIAREHARMAAGFLAQRPMPRAVRRALRCWHDYECAKLAWWDMTALRPWSALGHLARASRFDLLWPLGVLTAWRRKRRLRALESGPAAEAAA